MGKGYYSCKACSGTGDASWVDSNGKVHPARCTNVPFDYTNRRYDYWGREDDDSPQSDWAVGDLSDQIGGMLE